MEELATVRLELSAVRQNHLVESPLWIANLNAIAFFQETTPILLTKRRVVIGCIWLCIHPRKSIAAIHSSHCEICW